MFDPYSLPYATGRRVAIVTGANSGIGYYTTLHLYLHGYHVYLACRSEARAARAIADITITAEPLAKAHTQTVLGSLEYISLDLNSLKQTEEAAEILKRKEPNGIDILINNAGVMAWPVTITEDGYDIQSQVNHIAPTLFTLKLIPLLLKSTDPRVVFVSSIGHFFNDGAADLARTYDYWPVSFWGFLRYGNAKTASIQAAKALAARYPTRILFSSVHPGVCADTNLAQYYHDKPVLGALVKGIFNATRWIGGITSEEGSFTSLYAALAPQLTPERDNGKFWRPWPHEAYVHPVAENSAKIEHTWQWTVRELVSKGFLEQAEIDSLTEF
jgi:NAD(P)-dependent dehydrogenase (short-subunit alcohol dehydrogenase family)